MYEGKRGKIKFLLVCQSDPTRPLKQMIRFMVNNSAEKNLNIVSNLKGLLREKTIKLALKIDNDSIPHPFP